MATRVISVLMLALAAQLIGCGDSSGTAPAAMAAHTASKVGHDGGTLTGPNGAGAVIPPGALAADLPLAIGLPPVGTNPALPSSVAAVGATYALTPRGTEFATPVAIAIPFDPAQVPSGASVRLLRTSGEVNEGWSEVDGARPSGNVVKARASSAATFVVVVRIDPP